MKTQVHHTVPTAKTIREKVKAFVCSPFFILETILFSAVIMAWIGGPGYLIGLLVALITLWATRWDWSYFGLGRLKWADSIIPALGYVMLIILLNDFLVEPVLEMVTGEAIQLQSFDGLRGNLPNLFMMLVIMWVMAAFGEEFFYRGYVMNRLAHILGDKKSSWFVSAILSSIIFGLTHSYQGVSGMVTTGTVGFLLAFAFYQNRNNLWVGILAHGIYDTYGLSLIYFEKELIFKNMMIDIYQSILTIH